MSTWHGCTRTELIYVGEAVAKGGTFRIKKVSENRYVGLSTVILDFSDNQHLDH